MKTRLFTCLVGLLLCAGQAQAFDPCHPSGYAAIEKHYKKGLLFKVQKCGAPASYIFGTIHLDRPEITKAAAPAFSTMAKLSAAEFEVQETDAITRETVRDYLFFSSKEPKHLKNIVGEKDFGLLVLYLPKMSPVVLDRMHPWAAAIMLALADIIDGHGMSLDEKLRVAAMFHDNKLLGLESSAEQFQVFSGLSEIMQLHMLQDTLKHMDRIKKATDEMCKAYAERDAKKEFEIEMKLMAISDTPDEDAILFARLITERNKRMVERMQPQLQKESTLVSIGLMHLMGDEGVLHLLEKNGWFVEVVG